MSRTAQADCFVSRGAAEVDMGLNVGWVKYKKYKQVVEDAAAEKKACGNTSLKVIIEMMVCKDKQMVNACKYA